MEPVYFCKTFKEKDWKRLGLKPGDWVSYIRDDEAQLFIEKINPCDHCKNGVIDRSLD